jgi:acetylornithine deacetylase/succinyl-diaminopimelate desuccinylase-like protein
MDKEDLVALAMAIQRIPAPTSDERERAEYVRGEFVRAGLKDVQIDPAGNTLGHIGEPGEPALLVSAHMDSVFARDAVRPAHREGNRLRGPGIGDNALGVAALIGLALELPPMSLGTPVWLAGTVGEEGLGNLRGMRALVQRFGSRVSAYLAIEGMSLGSVYHLGLPARRLKITIRTQGGHSWTHAGQPSATHELVRLAERLLRLPLPARPRTTVNIGLVEGGMAINAIAAHASMELDLRSEDETVVAALERSVAQLASALATPDVQVCCESIGSRPGGGILPDHPLVDAAIRSLQASGIQEVHLGAGSTDASAPLSQGYASVCIGLTRGSKAHTLDEEIEVEPIARGYAALLRLVQEAACLANAIEPSASP